MAEAHRGLCAVALDQGAWPAAVAACGRALTYRPHWGVALTLRGHAYTAMGMNTSALDDFNAAITENPRLAEARFGRALLLQRMNVMAELPDAP